MILKKSADILAFLYCGLSVLRAAGPGLTLRKLFHQIYSRKIFWIVTRDLDGSYPNSSFNCTVRCALPEEVDVFFLMTENESEKSRYELLVRKWFHKQGIGIPYIARTIDTKEDCSIRWIITRDSLRTKQLEDRYLYLHDGEVMGENLYVPEKFRGQGAALSSGVQTWRILQKENFKRVVGCVAEDNISSLKFQKKAGSKIAGKMEQRHLLFCIKNSIIEEYNPPHDITLPA